MNNNSFLSKLTQISGSTLLSRIFGVVREILMVKYIGASLVSDAFFSAFKVPNSLRKIFAEGALSAALVPTIVHTMRSKGQSGVNHFISLAFVLFECLVLCLCSVIMWYAYEIAQIIVPGFSFEQIQQTALFLQLLTPFIFFISSSALLAGALQAVNHFFVPAFSPVILNIIFIVGLLVCTYFNLPVAILCWFILAGAFVQLIMHLVTYFKLNFRFTSFAWDDIKTFGNVLFKFIPCALSMSVNEAGLFIATSFASFLPAGSISLIYYANRFMGIPQGVFITALATILLPYFSRVSSYAPKRLSIYLLEAAKAIWWITLPTVLIMGFFSQEIFTTIFLSPDKFSYAQAVEAGRILLAFLLGLFFSALNKIILNIYYALHSTWLPGVIAIFSTIVMVGFSILLIQPLGAIGLALAISISGFAQTIVLILFLQQLHGFTFYWVPLLQFMFEHVLLVFTLVIPFGVLYVVIKNCILLLPLSWSYLLLDSVFFWFWVTPLCMLFVFILWKTKKTRLYFLD